MARWAGIGARIRARLLQMGYEKNGRADITRFCLEHRLLPTNVYRWVNADVLPERDNLLRLAGLLGVSPGWLLFGEEPEAVPAAGAERKRRRPVPIRGGSGAAHPLPTGDDLTGMRLIRHAMARWLAGLLQPSWATA